MNIKRKTLLLLSIIILLSLVLNMVVAPQHHKWYTDEPNALEKAKTYITGEEYSGIDFRHPIGWSLFLTVPFLILGLKSSVAFYATGILGSLTVINIFLISRFLFRNDRISLFSSFIYSMIPVVVEYSGTAVNNVAANFFMTGAIAAMLYSYSSNSKKLTIFTMAMVGFASLFRTENLFLFAYYLIGLFMLKEDEKNIKFNIRVFLIAILVVIPVLSANLDLYLSNSLASSNFGENVDTWSLENVGRSSSLFLGLISGSVHPLFFSALYLFGIYLGFKEKKKETTFLLVWIVPMLMSFALYFHTPPRFLIIIYPFLAVFAAFAIDHLIVRFSRIKHIKVFALLIIILAFLPFLKEVQGDVWVPHHLETYIPEMLKKDLKESCTIIAVEPTVIKAVTDIETIRASSFVDGTVQPTNDCLLFFDDMFCDGTFDRSLECKYIADNYNLQTYLEYSFEHDGFAKAYQFKELHNR